MVHSHQPLDRWEVSWGRECFDTCLISVRNFTHVHQCIMFIHYATGYNQSILSQRTMGVAYGQVKSSSLGCYWCIPINDWSSPLRVKPDGRSGLLFQISLQPSVCSELIEPNWPDHSLLSEYLNVASYLLRAYKTTSNAMPPLGWSDDLGESLTQMESIS